MGEVGKVDQFLGCRHVEIEETLEDGSKVRGMVYDMRKFMHQCVEAYEKLAGEGFICTHSDTPFVEEDDRENPARSPATSTGNSDAGGLVCPCCTEAFPNSEFTPVAGRREAEETVKAMRQAQAEHDTAEAY